MVCDFKALKIAVSEMIDRLDHAMAVNAADPAVRHLRAAGFGDRLVEFMGEDPTTEVIARRIFEGVTAAVREGKPLADEDGVRYTLPDSLVVERVRVSETPTTWAEFGV